jgi:Programmed cell death protein 2, C-terminal putative domain
MSIKQQQQRETSKSTKMASKTGSRLLSNARKRSVNCYGYEQSIPVCNHCGTELRFELQIVPSILHILNVDAYTVENDKSTPCTMIDDDTKSNYSYNSTGGMDWGNIVVYACPNVTSCRSTDVYCIIQDSVDHIHSINAKPDKNNHNTTPLMPQQQQNNTVTAVVIPEGSKFDDDDDDDDGIILKVDDEEEFDEYDDGSIW